MSTKKWQILGSVTKQPDWSQTDETAIDYIKNKPDVGILTATTADNGKFLRVVNGSPSWEAISNAEGVEF